MIVQWFLHVYIHILTQSPSYFGLILIGREMRLCVCVCVLGSRKSVGQIILLVWLHTHTPWLRDKHIHI